MIELENPQKKNIGVIGSVLHWLNKPITTQCPRCTLGRVSHSHSEPIGWTTIEVYKCDKCHTEFV